MVRVISRRGRWRLRQLSSSSRLTPPYSFNSSCTCSFSSELLLTSLFLRLDLLIFISLFWLLPLRIRQTKTKPTHGRHRTILRPCALPRPVALRHLVTAQVKLGHLALAARPSILQLSARVMRVVHGLARALGNNAVRRVVEAVLASRSDNRARVARHDHAE